MLARRQLPPDRRAVPRYRGLCLELGDADGGLLGRTRLAQRAELALLLAHLRELGAQLILPALGAQPQPVLRHLRGGGLARGLPVGEERLLVARVRGLLQDARFVECVECGELVLK